VSLAEGIHEFFSDRLSVGDRIYPLMLPQGATLPAVTYQTISDIFLTHHTTAQDHPVHTPMREQTTRIQFNCYGRTYDEAEALRNELLAVAVGYRGTWGDVEVGAVFADLGLDDFEPEPNHWRWLQDLIVKHRGGGVAVGS
jgi:hypothetical protein